jgi:nucleotide-binding universal stress UspA family protein
LEKSRILQARNPVHWILSWITVENLMVKKVLAAMDLSENNESIFEQAIELATASKADLMLLHVLSYEEANSPSPVLSVSPYTPDPIFMSETWEIHRQEWEKYERQGLELLRSLCERATAAGLQAEFTQTSGSTGRVICDLARSWEAEVIVMGRRSHSRLGELFLGSVSNYVVHQAPCSVFIVRHPLAPLSK